MQVYILELQGTGEDEYAFENAGVFSTHDLAEERLAEINADYTDYEDAFFKLDENARIEEYKLDA